MKIFIIDIDGTISEHIANEEGIERMRTAKGYPEVIKEINKWYDEGHYICFFTARTSEHEVVTREWLKKNGVMFHQLIMNKPRKLPPYTEYHFIDDAHVKATTFKGKITPFVRKRVSIEVFEE
ncbi:MAG: phosphoheptose isomerase [Thaumarchaeota archaeon]|nr:phosphoheptose isomerase [Nitrososphaerota archaeon]